MHQFVAARVDKPVLVQHNDRKEVERPVKRHKTYLPHLLSFAAPTRWFKKHH
ncbi:hypothetical protein BT69DRAFT_1277576 [Atractiella rhizophila]|nr:hypothetical protein BT69DRAFT_1277576 [Atractiella rhizophila]